MNKEYLGDSVYAELNGHNEIILTTENGAEVCNMIYLDRPVIDALLGYIARTVKKEFKIDQ